MKTGPAGLYSAQSGYSLPGLLISTSIFLILVAGIISSHIFGLRLMEITQSRQGVFNSPKNFDALLTELRTAREIRVGTGTASSFTEAAVNSLQQGNAVQLYFSSDQNSFIRYFLDTQDRKVKRRDLLGNITTRFEFVANDLVFSSESFQGQILTNRQSSFLLAVRLNFSALKEPNITFGTDNLFTSYTLNTRIAKRSPE